MLNNDIRVSEKKLPIAVYFLCTLFIVFFSVHAIQNWQPHLAQSAIILACILPAFIVLAYNWSSLIKNKTWPVEFKIVLVLTILGMLNICFSENQLASLKGMSLYLMSGILVFSISYSLFDNKQTQMRFFYLCSFCFIILLGFGTYEFIQQIYASGKRILLFSGNPIPAGSLLILLSIGPLVLLGKSKSNWQRIFWVFCILSGAFLITLIAQRGPALAMVIMAFFLAATKRKGIWIFTLVALVLVTTGYQLADKVPPQLKNELLRKETLLVRMELYHIALDVIKEKPIFGLGFNSSLSRFIPDDYQSKIYPTDQTYSFQSMVAGVHVFDNMALSFLGEMGGLFTMAYLGLGVYLLINVVTVLRKPTLLDNMQVILTLVVLAGFTAHSMTFDSLKYPHLNWIFHSLLGLIARHKVTDQKIKTNAT
ncbi:MAG: O-antigen ligase family protein [Nitrospina sp.]|jgi:O-antigen ligase|nr:O-antigen ligase family protein [Nitrospina sp.]MBT5632658.1 O-antigen ligase family protein [Nitrospina sp.]